MYILQINITKDLFYSDFIHIFAVELIFILNQNIFIVMENNKVFLTESKRKQVNLFMEEFKQSAGMSTEET